METRRKWKRKIIVNGMRLAIELLPSLWLKAPFYGIMVTSKSEGTVSLKINRSFAHATKADFTRLLKRIRLAPCSKDRCRNRFLVGDETATENPDRFCQSHWLKHLQVQAAKEQLEAKDRIARDETKARSRGYRFKALVWIHRNSANDYAVVRYFASKPSEKQLEQLARKKHSKVIGDWSVERL